MERGVVYVPWLGLLQNVIIVLWNKWGGRELTYHKLQPIVPLLGVARVPAKWYNCPIEEMERETFDIL
jgi:hypothetical protein